MYRLRWEREKIVGEQEWVRKNQPGSENPCWGVTRLLLSEQGLGGRARTEKGKG